MKQIVQAETYTRTDGQIGRMYRVSGGNDNSPAYSGRYSFTCDCCYLGFPHSTLAHAEKALTIDPAENKR